MSDRSTDVRGASRRAVLTAGLGAVGSAALWSGGFIGIANARTAIPSEKFERRMWTGSTSGNGWPIVDTVPLRAIEGSDVGVAVLDGDVGTVLLHVARRFHYEIDALRKGDVAGHTTEREITADYESNHLSATAIAIRPWSYPVGIGGGLFPNELTVVRDILLDVGDVVRWGGDEQLPKESDFHIAVGPRDPALKAVADRIRGWNVGRGRGAGATNSWEPARLRAAGSNR